MYDVPLAVFLRETKIRGGQIIATSDDRLAPKM